MNLQKKKKPRLSSTFRTDSSQFKGDNETSPSGRRRSPFLSGHEASRHVQVLPSVTGGTGLSSLCLPEPSPQTVPLQVDPSLLTAETPVYPAGNYFILFFWEAAS